MARTSATTERFALAAVLAVALAVRVGVLLWAFPDGALPTGPDADDWVGATLDLLRGNAGLMAMNRLPLVPAVTALLCSVTGLGPVPLLVLTSVLSTTLLAGATWEAGRTVLGVGGATAAALWVALDPTLVTLGVSVSAYPVFALAFVVAAGALLGAWGRAGPVVAGLAAFVATGTLHQGLLSLLVLLPVAAFTRKGRAAGAVAFGAALATGFSALVHARHLSTVTWLPREAWKYLGGNIPEELERAGGSYWTVLRGWSLFSLDITAPTLLTILALTAVGLALRLRRGRTRMGALAVGCSVAPLVVLIPTMASAHHLVHLTPLLAVAAVAGATTLLPWAPQRVPVLLPRLLLLALVARIGGDARLAGLIRGEGLSTQVAEAHAHQAIAEGIVAVVSPPALVLVAPLPDGWREEEIISSAWALPVEISVVRTGSILPSTEERLLGDSAPPMWILAVEDDGHQAAGGYPMEPTGPGTALSVAHWKTPIFAIPVRTARR